MIQRFSDQQVAVIKALGVYKFLTYEQMKRLNIGKHTSNLSTNLKLLRESKRPLVRKIPHRIGTSVKHYLTSYGKKVLVDHFEIDEEKVHCPKGLILTDTQDQKHRTSIIDIHILLNQFCEQNNLDVLLVERYFDKTGNPREGSLKSKTAYVYEGKKTIKADLTFIIQTKAQEELYLLELENGKDTKKAVEKCINHGKAIILGSANEKYSFNEGYRTLWVFEYESTMLSTVNRLQEIPFFNNMREYFLFKTLADLKENFGDGWANIDAESRKLYYI